MAKITLIGMHNYTDGDIWGNVVLPSAINKEQFINTILLNYGEMETLYADPDMMKFAITNWANINNWSILKAVTAINIEYEPLNNYDRTETRTKSGTNTGTVTDSGNTSVSTNTRTVTDRDETNETEHKVSAYDSSSYSPDNTDDGSNTMDETVTGNGTSTGTSGNTRTDNLAHAEQENVRAFGNIGVTTSQQMLQSELDISLYNIYETFAGIFAFDLLLMVY